MSSMHFLNTCCWAEVQSFAVLNNVLEDSINDLEEVLPEATLDQLLDLDEEVEDLTVLGEE